MNVVEVSNKGARLVFCVGRPEHENVVNEAPRVRACSHGYAVCLDVEGVVEFKSVHSKDHPDEVAESLSAYGVEEDWSRVLR